MGLETDTEIIIKPGLRPTLENPSMKYILVQQMPDGIWWEHSRHRVKAVAHRKLREYRSKYYEMGQRFFVFELSTE